MSTQLLSDPVRLGELFCGPGGLGYGAKLAAHDLEINLHHMWANDVDESACLTYQNNVADGSTKVINGSVTELDLESLDKVDGLLFGFPCNDFSLVGQTRGIEGEFGGLYSYGVEILKRQNPSFFLAENVTGLSSANSGTAFQIILNSLANAGTHGYDLCVHQYDFQYYGVPQARRRIIVAGFRGDLGIKKSYLPPAPQEDTIPVKEALRAMSDSLPNHEKSKISDTVKQRLGFIKPGQNAWSAELPKHLQLNVRGAKLSNIYKRLDPDKASYTITGSGGGGTHVYHWREPRSLTNRERARIQSFPDNFEFFGSKEQVRRQIGMAVPVEGARRILSSVFRRMMGIDYEGVAPSYGHYDCKTTVSRTCITSRSTLWKKNQKLLSDDLFSL